VCSRACGGWAGMNGGMSGWMSGWVVHFKGIVEHGGVFTSTQTKDSICSMS
jgi:hypothetical protein